MLSARPTLPLLSSREEVVYTVFLFQQSAPPLPLTQISAIVTSSLIATLMNAIKLGAQIKLG
jgi:hypothetical protein